MGLGLMFQDAWAFQPHCWILSLVVIGLHSLYVKEVQVYGQNKQHAQREANKSCVGNSINLDVCEVLH